MAMTTKSGLVTAIAMVIVSALVAKLRAAFNTGVPVGYQDEDGFHFGAEPLDHRVD